MKGEGAVVVSKFGSCEADCLRCHVIITSDISLPVFNSCVLLV